MLICTSPATQTAEYTARVTGYTTEFVDVVLRYDAAAVFVPLRQKRMKGAERNMLQKAGNEVQNGEGTE